MPTEQNHVKDQHKPVQEDSKHKPGHEDHKPGKPEHKPEHEEHKAGDAHKPKSDAHKTVHNDAKPAEDSAKDLETPGLLNTEAVIKNDGSGETPSGDEEKKPGQDGGKPAHKTPAKKAAAKQAGKDDAGEMRRAHEHLGRVEILHEALKPEQARSVDALTKLAHHELEAGHAKNAADLLRAAEHLSFAALAPAKAEKQPEPKLAEALQAEFDSKLEKADEHWSDQEKHHKVLDDVYRKATEHARAALDEGAYRKALEFVRGAEALAHVKIDEPKHLPEGTNHPS